MAPKALNGWIFLLPFDGAKSLYLSRIFAPGVGSSLKELIGDRITEVFPALQKIGADGLRDYRLPPAEISRNLRH
jgi:hypothetical protein